MNDLFDVYRKYINDRLVLAVAGNPAEAGEGLASKLKIKPVNVRGNVMYQVTRTVGAQEKHENLDADAAARLLAASADRSDTSVEQHFRQIEIKSDSTNVVTMVSKKGTVTTKEHRLGNGAASQPKEPARDHNRAKNYVLPEGEPIPFLVELGVMTASGAVVKAKYDKFRQINRYLEFVEDIIPSLPKGREISIIDFGCGKSYLTFALYYYLREVRGFDVRITGLDLKKEVIENCNSLARRFGYGKLEFLHGDIADYTGTDSVDMVVTLHACDTATDYALYKAIKWNARVIFCVPCCQHELNRLIKDEQRACVMKYGLIKERVAALYTDAFRANILEEQGYKTQVLEFIDMEHTPKNILIRAVKTAKPMGGKAVAAAMGNGGQDGEYLRLMDELGVHPTLYRLIHETESET